MGQSQSQTHHSIKSSQKSTQDNQENILTSINSQENEPNLKNQLEKALKSQGFTSKIIKSFTKPVSDADNPNRNKDYPYSAIVSLDIFFQNGKYLSGTGFMISSRYIVTVESNIYDDKKIAETIFASPGRDKWRFPYGVHLVTHVYKEFESINDIPIVILRLEKKIGFETGWFKLMELSSFFDIYQEK